MNFAEIPIRILLEEGVAKRALRSVPSPLMSFYRRVLAYYRPDLGPTIVAMVLTLLANGFNILRPWPLKYIIDQVVPAASRTPNGLVLAGFDLGLWSIPAVVALVCVLMVAFQLCAGGIGYFVNIITIRVGLHGLMRVRTELYAYLHSLPPASFTITRRSADSSLLRVAHDSCRASRPFTAKASSSFQSVISLVTSLLPP